MADGRLIVEVGTSLRNWGSIERYALRLAQGLPRYGWRALVLTAPRSPLSVRAGGLGSPVRFRAKYDWTAFPSFVRFFRRSHPEIVHLHYSPDYLVPAVAAKVAGCRVVATRHLGLPYSRRKVLLLKGRIDLWVGVSEFVSSVLSLSGFDPQRVRTVHSGVPRCQAAISREKARAHFRVTPGRIAIGYFGRLEREKGIESALAGCVGAEDFEWHIFGGGRLEHRLRNAYSDPNVVFHGNVEDVADAMSAMDVIVIPSQWDEAFPFVALEAMSLGLPIVATNVGGLPEAIQDGVTGLLVPRGHPGSIRAALEDLALHPEKRQRLGLAARERYEERFTLEAMLDRYNRLFQEWLEA